MNRTALCAAALALLALPACSISTEFGEEVFNSARAQWTRTAPAAYSFQLLRSCTCATPKEPIRIEVRNGAVVSRTYTSSSAALEAQFASAYPSVNGLFDLIAEARRQKPVRLNSEYSSTYGYPTTVLIDLDGSRTDDDLILNVTEFTPLP